MKKLFNASFEQSTKIAMKKNGGLGIMWSNDYREINHNSYLNRIVIVFIAMGFLLMTVVCECLSLTSRNSHLDLLYPGTGMYIYYLGVVVMPLFAIFCFAWICTSLSLLLPMKNLLIQRIRGVRMMICFTTGVILSIVPLAFGSMLGNAGIIFTILQMIIIILYTYCRFEETIKTDLHLMYGDPINRGIIVKKFRQLFGMRSTDPTSPQIFSRVGHLVLLYLITVMIGVIEIQLTHNSFELERVAICGLGAVAFIILIECLVLLLKTLLTWSYVKKYPTQYRLYYQISDRVWYLSEKRAAKHPHVYPPVPKETNETINKNA